MNLKKLRFTIIIITLIHIINIGFAQEKLDTIYTNNKIIACYIEEVTPESVRFVYPGESIKNSIYINTIQKIVFKTGREQKFSSVTNYRAVSTGDDWENVTITMVESEILGLFKLDNVSSKAKGTTAYANMNKVKDRAYKKLQIESAMNGGNIVYIVNQETEGNKYGYYSSTSTSTNLTGVAYSDQIPDFSAFKTKIGEVNNDFYLTEIHELGNNDVDLQKKSEINLKVKLFEIQDRNGLIYTKAIIPGVNETDFRISYFDDNKIILMCRDSKKIYNYILR